MDSRGEFDPLVFQNWLREKILLQSAGPNSGFNGKPICLVVVDTQISNDSILEDLNNLLNSGEVPNIFPKEDQEKLKKDLTDLYSMNKVNIEPREIWKKFVERVRENLHIILCMSPVGDSLKIWCRKFPALVNCCTIDWYENWSGEALKSVSYRLLKDERIENLDEISTFMNFFHEKANKVSLLFQNEMKRKFFITPKTALDNIK